MAFVTNQFLDDLTAFSKSTMTWCSKESEEAISKVNKILSLIIENAKRVSALSQETINAITSMQEVITHLGSDNRQSANNLAKTLKNIALQDKQINEFISPIIETLQFQDRITQNMNNLAKMMECWLQFRKKLDKTKPLSEEQRIEFGKMLLDFTCMKEEREVIHSHIDGIPIEEQETSNILFF